MLLEPIVLISPSLSLPPSSSHITNNIPFVKVDTSAMTASIVGTTASSIVSGPKSSRAANNSTTTSSYWKPLPFLSTPRQDAACTLVDLSSTTQAVVVAGGRNSQAPSLDKVELLEWNVLRRWWPLPSTQTARCGCALVAFGRRLYVLGGINAGESTRPQATMETFEIMGPVNEWTTVAEPMATPRMYPGAVAYGEGEQQVILVVGGRDHTWRELDSCELYTVETGKWEGVLSMTTPRFGCGLVYLKSSQSVLAVGGYTGTEWTTSCELYHPGEDKWMESPSMPRVVQFCSATVMRGPANEEYVVVRGRPVSKETTDVSVVGLLQCYNITTKEWIVLPPILETVGAAVTTVDQSRLLAFGGGSGEDLEATSMCRFWLANLPKLFAGGDGDAASVGNSSAVPRPPTNMLSPRRKQSADSTEQGDGDEESTVHPFLHAPPSSSASVASASTNFTATSRRKVENETIMDNAGVQVHFTGFLASESGRPHGKGRMTWPLSGDRYEGRFEHGARQGRGHMIYNNGDSFLGFFQNDQREGKGTYHYLDGRSYEGHYVNDMADDPAGRMRWKDGTTYEGQFTRGKRTGQGKIVFPKSNVEYSGDFVNGKYHGRGFCRFPDGSVYTGQWKHGKAHGQGKLTDSEGNVVHDGKWVNDGPVYD